MILLQQLSSKFKIHLQLSTIEEKNMNRDPNQKQHLKLAL